MLYDHVHGTNFSKVQEPFMDWFLKTKMIDPDTHETALFYLVKQDITVDESNIDLANILSLITVPLGKLDKKYGFMNLRSSAINGWNGTFMHAWKPDFIARHYPYQLKNHIIELDSKTARITKDWITDQLSTGFFAMFIAEMGDLELRDKLVKWTEDQYKPVWEGDGSFHYPSGHDNVFNLVSDTTVSNVTTDKLVALARALPKNGMWDMHNKPFDGTDEQIPKVTEVNFPYIVLRRAIYDREREVLVISTQPGKRLGSSTTLKVIQLDPQRKYCLKLDNREIERFTGRSSINIEVPLNRKHDIILAAE